MIVYVTGVPGSAKTLWTIKEVEAKRIEQKRDVYYWRIPELTLPWERLADDHDIEGARLRVHNLPKGSIIVCDECHKLYPQRGPGKQVPEYVEQFDEHRHRGHDFFLITQAPEQVDHFIKYRVGRHIHLKRKFGLERSTVYEWNELADVRDKRAYFDSVKRQFKFPKDIYGVYKSADQHTKATKVPWGKLAGIAVFPIIAIGAAAYFYVVMFGEDKTDENLHVASTGRLGPFADTGEIVDLTDDINDPDKDKIRSLIWARQWREILKGSPHSVEFYQELLQPATIPKIDGCSHVQHGAVDRCTCNTQQGTTITSIDHKSCLYYVKNGWFDPFKSDDDGKGDDDEDQQGGGSFAGGAGDRTLRHASQSNPFTFE